MRGLVAYASLGIRVRITVPVAVSGLDFASLMDTPRDERSFPPSQLEDSLLKLGRGEMTPAEVLGLQPKVLEELAERAVTAVQAGDFKSGEQRLLQLAVLDTRSPRFPLLLALARARRGAHAEALEMFDEAARRAHEITNARLEAEARLGRVESLLALGDRLRAVEDLRAVAETGPRRDAERARARLAVLLTPMPRVSSGASGPV